MNILQLAKYYPPIYGGIELVEKMMTKSHCENGDRVFVCAFASKSEVEMGEFGETIFRLHEDFNFIRSPFNFSLFISFKKIIIENKIDRIFVHLPNPFMNEVIHLNKKFLNKNKVDVVGVYHSDIVNKSFLGDLYNFYFLLNSSIYDRILVSTKELWDSSNVLKKIAISKRLVVPFCIEENEIVKKDRIFSKKLITIGRFVPYKGFDFLIDTFNDSDYELHIIGNGPLRKKLEEKAKRNIFFHYDLTNEQKNKLLANSDLLIVGSLNRAEAYGMTIVESFSQSIPVIAPDLNTGVSFLVQNEVTGLVYPVGNSVELLKKIDLIKRDGELYKKISKGCNEFYKNKLTYEIFKESLLKI